MKTRFFKGIQTYLKLSPVFLNLGNERAVATFRLYLALTASAAFDTIIIELLLPYHTNELSTKAITDAVARTSNMVRHSKRTFIHVAL